MPRFLVVVLFFSTCVYGFAQAQSLPAIGTWNGFLQHVNVVECSNLTQTSVSVRITVLDSQGHKMSAVSLDLAGRGTGHIILNDLPIADTFGTYRVERRSGGTNPEVDCHTVLYRMSPIGSDKDVEYAFVLPALMPIYGESSGIFNSFNPDGGSAQVSAGGNSIPVSNFLSIFNAGKRKFSTRIFFYDQSGKLLKSKTLRIVNLNPLERRDFAVGHPSGQNAGLYRIVPDDPSLAYGAFLTRYASNGQSGFRFAIALTATPGLCDSGPIPTSTMNPANNWIEIANPTNHAVKATLKFSDAQGGSLFETERVLKAHSQVHYYVNSYLDENNVGSFRAICSKPEQGDKLLLQSLYYGHAETSARTDWAYASQARGELFTDEPVAFPLNTYLDSANWVKIIDAGSSAATFNFETANMGGAISGRGKAFLPNNGALDVPLHSLVGKNYAGLAVFFPKASTTYYPEIVRVFPDRSLRIGCIMNLPGLRTSLTETNSDDDTPPGPSIFASSMVVLGYNDLGMHCMNQDFSEMMILPPANNLRALVIDRRGEDPRIVQSGISLTYDIPGNTESVSKTNFWTYAKALLGVDLAPGMGLTGNKLEGNLQPNGSAKDWIASAIPVTQTIDSRADNPYQLATISVHSNGSVVARTRAVVPVSWEISCNLCHNSVGASPATDILRDHDQLHGTHLENEKPVACGRCHAQAPLNLPGATGVPSLSRAMHGAHASRMQAVSSTLGSNTCYACHPGNETKCLRDVHFSKGMGCKDCHGEMADVAAKANPWVDEPRCESCHKQRRPDFDFEEPGKLFKDSKGHHGVPCEACHGSTHALAPSVVAADNLQSLSLQGHAGTINTCTVCHNKTPDDPFTHSLKDDD